MNESNSTSMPEELNDERLDYCGANFCSSLTIITNNSDSADPVSIIEKPSVELIQLLAGILLGFSLLATVIIVTLIDGNVGYIINLFLNSLMTR